MNVLDVDSKIVNKNVKACKSAVLHVNRCCVVLAVPEEPPHKDEEAARRAGGAGEVKDLEVPKRQSKEPGNLLLGPVRFLDRDDVVCNAEAS